MLNTVDAHESPFNIVTVQGFAPPDPSEPEHALIASLQKPCLGRVATDYFSADILISVEAWIKLRPQFEHAARTIGGIMEWTAPAFEEVCLNCEINSYASAKL